MGIKKEVIEGVKWFSVVQLISSILSFIRMPIIAYFIIPEEYGVMAIIYMLIAFGAIFSDSGIGKAWVQKQTNSSTVFSTVFWLNIFVCTALYIVFYLSRDLVSCFFNNDQLLTLIPYACAAIFLLLLVSSIHFYWIKN